MQELKVAAANAARSEKDLSLMLRKILEGMLPAADFQTLLNIKVWL